MLQLMRGVIRGPLFSVENFAFSCETID